jgi:hypothetical protein
MSTGKIVPYRQATQMNKYFLFIIVIHVFTVNVMSQDIEDAVVKDICNCLQDVDSVQNPEKISEQVGACISQGYTLSKSQIKTFLNDQEDKQKAFNDFNLKVIFYVVYHDHKSFYLLKKVQSQLTSEGSLDSLIELYDTWDPSKVKISSNAVDITEGVFESIENEPLHSQLILMRDKIYEVMPFNLDTVEFRVERMGRYQYKTIYIGSKKGFDIFHAGEEFIVKVTEVTDSGYSVLIPIGEGRIWRGEYRKLKQ